MEHPITGDLPTSTFIKSSYLFKSLDLDGTKMLLDGAVLQTVQEGERIISEGEDGNSFYLIKTGSVAVFVEKEGERTDLSTLKRGAFFGEVAVLNDMKRTASVDTNETCELIVFTKENIQNVLRSYPRVSAILQTMLLARAEKTAQR